MDSAVHPRAPSGLLRALNAAAKRAMDIVLALVLLALSSPALLFGAIGVKLSSPGPLFYRARRVGRGGREFGMLKFRSMHVNDGSGPAITAPGDSRIFPFGALIRKLKIDELPQLINVLRGDMSFVGPRPEDPRLVRDHYTPRLMQSLAVRPGLTSPGTLYYMAQFRQAIDPKDAEASYIATTMGPKLEIDMAYMERENVFLDMGLILRTGWIILLRMLNRDLHE